MTIEKTEKRIVLVSATRLSFIKGKERMRILGDELNRQGIKFIWYVFTNDTNEIINKNIIFLQPRLDVLEWIREADYVVQLSDTERVIVHN